jgi:hypothetical protein
MMWTTPFETSLSASTIPSVDGKWEDESDGGLPFNAVRIASLKVSGNSFPSRDVVSKRLVR